MRILFALAIILVARLALACLADGQNCAHTVSVCCEGLVPSDPDRMTGCKCVPGEATTTTTLEDTSTTTSTTVTPPATTTTTTTLVPAANEFSFLFTPSDLRVTDDEPPGFTGTFVDPRTGLVANQFLLATMAWQYEAYSMEMVALADAAGCRFNEGQIMNANFKFGGDYVLNHSAFPSGGAYHWLHPSYIRQYTTEPLVQVAPCLAEHGMLTPDLAQIAGLADGITSPPPAVPNTTFQGGTSYSPYHYPPLTDAQCAALQTADDAHMAHDQALLVHDFATADANNAAVGAAQRAFESTALDYDQATLFKWVWQANYNRGNPQDVLDSLTQQIIDTHHEVMLAYNCETHESPDAARILHYELQHNFLHDCRATTHWLDRQMQTVCAGAQISSCPHLTCREQALGTSD